MSTVEAMSGRRRQWLAATAIFVAVVAALVAGYVLFLREPDVILAEGLRPVEAAAIVAELDERGAAYSLADGGTTIRVPQGDADATRLAIAGSEVAANGLIGFELFNKSDMGLTNFAQKINFQRALQGELVRTIGAMEGVEGARVHLALPERALFRDDRTEPTAAVSVMMRPGHSVNGARVAGIQRLVAAAVPDLKTGNVVVLNGEGRVLSQVGAFGAELADAGPLGTADRATLEDSVLARARDAIATRMPDLRFRLLVAVVPLNGGAGGAVADGGAVPVGDSVRLALTLITDAALSQEEQLTARSAIAPAVDLDANRGDSLRFEVGPTGAVAAEDVAMAASPVAAPSTGSADPDTSGWLARNWWIIAVALLLSGLVARRWHLARREALSPDDHDAFAQTLRRQLSLMNGPSDAAV